MALVQKYVCDACHQPILLGYMVEGRLWRMTTKPTRLLLGDRNTPQMHFCDACFAARLLAPETPDKGNTK